MEKSSRRMSGSNRHLKILTRNRLPVDELERGRREYPEASWPSERPQTYGDCVEVGLGTAAQPCPFTTCGYHLAMDVSHAGTLTLNHPGREIEQLPETCVLRVADRGEASLQQIAAVMNCTKERVSQIEAMALHKLQRAAAAGRFGDLGEDKGPEVWETTRRRIK